VKTDKPQEVLIIVGEWEPIDEHIARLEREEEERTQRRRAQWRQASRRYRVKKRASAGVTCKSE
jgi:hypothetical protein